MCSICKIKNVRLLEEIERRLNANAGSLTDKDKKELVQNFATDAANSVEAAKLEDTINNLTPSECSLHWNFHQAVIVEAPSAIVPGDADYSDADDTISTDAIESTTNQAGKVTGVRKPMGSLAADVGKSEAAVLYGLLGKQMATFNALTNRMNETLVALGESDEDKTQALSLPVIHPSMAAFYNELAGSIRATTKELRELNAAVNGQANPAMEGLKALAFALHGTPSEPTNESTNNGVSCIVADDLTTDKYDY